jgi:hypothetical protein
VCVRETIGEPWMLRLILTTLSLARMLSTLRKLELKSSKSEAEQVLERGGSGTGPVINGRHE